MTQRIIRLAVAAGAAVALVAPGSASAVVCTDRPFDHCVDYLKSTVSDLLERDGGS